MRDTVFKLFVSAARRRSDFVAAAGRRIHSASAGNRFAARILWREFFCQDGAALDRLLLEEEAALERLVARSQGGSGS